MIRALMAIAATMVWSAAALSEEPMSIERLQRVVSEVATKADSRGPVMRFAYEGQRMMLIADPDADRMRIMAPITNVSQVTDSQLRRCMEANFASAVDARYAINDGVLFAAYLHPLSSLHRRQVKRALRQVQTLAETFGAGYHAGSLGSGSTR